MYGDLVSMLKGNNKESHSSTNPFLLIHSNVWGPAPIFYFHELSYVLFVDDCTRMNWVYFLKHKSEGFFSIC